MTATDEQGLSQYVRCTRPWTGFEVEHDGAVKPCCMSRVVCGNTNGQSIRQIWNGPVYRDFRRRMLADDLVEVCRADCPNLHGRVADRAPDPKDPAFAANYARNQREIAEGADTLESSPRFWKVTHSTLCNLDCIQCYQDRDDRRELPGSFYEQLTEHYRHIQEIEMIGGEPFVIRNLRRLLQDFPKQKFPDVRFSIVTNGTVYDRATQDLVRQANISWMAISLDAVEPATYAQIRRRGDLHKALGGVQAWAALGRECGFAVSIAFTIMPENLHQLSAFVTLGIEHQVDCLFGRVQGRDGELVPLDATALADQIDGARAIIRDRGVAMPLANLTLTSIESVIERPA